MEGGVFGGLLPPGVAFVLCIPVGEKVSARDILFYTLPPFTFRGLGAGGKTECRRLSILCRGSFG